MNWIERAKQSAQQKIGQENELTERKKQAEKEKTTKEEQEKKLIKKHYLNSFQYLKTIKYN